MKSSLRTKILLSVGLIIFVVLGTSTLVHIQDLKRNYLEALDWRAEALAQNTVREIVELLRYKTSIQGMFGSLSLKCSKLYESNKEKNVTHCAVIDTSGVIAAHSNRELRTEELSSQAGILLQSVDRFKLSS